MPPKKSDGQNIRVAVRSRPLNANEIANGDLNIVESCRDHKITLRDKSTSTRSYVFDRVFGPRSKQAEVYNEMVAPVVLEVIEGYNCTIFAYGQTGTGKTYTMTGERSDALRYTWENDPTAGIVPRALNQIFSVLESMGSVVVKGLREVAVLNKEEVYDILERGLARRQTACTILNAQSSRSHSVFTVTVHIKEICPKDGEVFLKIGKLNLVDLAGSENIGRSGALDKRAREAGSINQSLLTLGRVITCLVDHAPHIPYRESKLTRLLQDSLGGRTKTSIIATVSPANSCLEETLSTLDYAHRAKNIQNRPEINQKLNKKELIKGYNEELERLRRDLEASRSKTGIFIDADNYQTIQLQLSQQRARIDDLEERRELLTSDLEAVKNDFELSRQELAEIRAAKEKVEEEFRKCADDLHATTRRLQKIERKWKEEEFLRSQHQSTESKLSKQARTIISVASVYHDDVQRLHEKLERVDLLDRENREVIESISSTWLSQQLQEPINLLQCCRSEMDSQFQNLSKKFGKLHVACSAEVNRNSLCLCSKYRGLAGGFQGLRCAFLFIKIVLVLDTVANRPNILERLTKEVKRDDAVCFHNEIGVLSFTLKLLYLVLTSGAPAIKNN
ncbi:unnamed protein product [Dibothriocephalus latus]|uniref:Kinesin-like protein n=1 Tax=Dibothriocephalus latus TaxID=60516 RepID=A0A3P6TF48_DIBLA|nr:unnamed protein product [Dibothriocephalus latus]